MHREARLSHLQQIRLAAVDDATLGQVRAFASSSAIAAACSAIHVNPSIERVILHLNNARCPSCFSDLAWFDTVVRCRSCLHAYPVVEGVPVLMEELAGDSALELEQYEIDHPADLNARASLFNVYYQALQEHGVHGGACLEIGSGTGNLTAGLVSSNHFDEVNCSDLSIRFIRRLRATVTDTRNLRYWLFDAQQIPFKDGSMNAVFGHSVLHHLLNYEAAIAEVFRVLRPGGLAMFGEPIMDNHSITGFCAGLILELEKRSPTDVFSDSDLATLALLRGWSSMVGSKMRYHREELSHLEDKHIYVIDDMLKLGRKIGFSMIDYQNSFLAERIGDDHYFQLSFMMDRLGGAGTKLGYYKFIFDELTSTYGVAMGSAAPVNFGYFILKK